MAYQQHCIILQKGFWYIGPNSVQFLSLVSMAPQYLICLVQNKNTLFFFYDYLSELVIFLYKFSIFLISLCVEHNISFVHPLGVSFGCQVVLSQFSLFSPSLFYLIPSRFHGFLCLHVGSSSQVNLFFFLFSIDCGSCHTIPLALLESLTM